MSDSEALQTTTIQTVSRRFRNTGDSLPPKRSTHAVAVACLLVVVWGYPALTTVGPFDGGGERQGPNPLELMKRVIEERAR